MINRRIRKFNEERGMINSFNALVEYENLEEELQEFYDAKTESEQVDALCDIIVFASGALIKMGYSVTDAMDETLKELESRKQDPIQAMRWTECGSSGEKWQKNENQCPDTKYQADYTKAKR